MKRLLLVVLALVASLITPVGAAHAGTPRAVNAPIVVVHGYIPGACPGYNTRSAMFGPAQYAWYYAGEYGRPYDAVDYYKCDVGGADIGSSADNNTPIERIAFYLAWWIYNTYSYKGQTIELVGHSMGGLIIREMLDQFSKHQHRYPGALLVQDVVTVASPLQGANACAGTVQCTEMQPGSAFLQQLSTTVPQGTGGTDWTVMGGSPCDSVVPGSSSLVLTGAHVLDYSAGKPLCYDHNSYMWDAGTAQDEIVNGQPGPHSLAAIVQALDSGSY